MTSGVGIACGTCDWLNPRDARRCTSCGGEIALLPGERCESPEDARGRDDEQRANGHPGGRDEDLKGPSAEPAAIERDGEPPDERETVAVRQVVVVSGGDRQPDSESKEQHMQQARHHICKSCYSPIPGGHKFCGKCGAPTEFGKDAGVTQFYGAMQVPNKAKLILIRGEGLDGISYHLNSTEHVAGRQQGAILFPDDAWLSPRHANFFYRDQKLFVRDEGSLNGVFWRIQGPTPLTPGTMFLCGEQVFKLDLAQPLPEGPEPDQTYFYASPSKAWSFRVVQVLNGGVEGMVVHDENGLVTIGREDCDMNFPLDRFLSDKHAQIEDAGGQFVLTDLGSQNGTFVRIQEQQELVHGDYVFLGKQLLRVEVTP